MMSRHRPFPLSQMSEEAGRQKLATLRKKFCPIPLPEMSEETQQQKLASARKMLCEFQLKNNLPIPPRVKKKEKVQKGPETSMSGGHSPGNMPKDRATPPSPADDTTPPGSVNLACASSPCTRGMASPNNSDAKNGPLALEENKTMSSTETLQQISRPFFHGFLPESSPSINRKDQTSSNDMKTLESRYQESSLALDSSSPTHDQLTKKIQELNQEKQDAFKQLEEVIQEFEQNFINQQGALRQRLQEQHQTIGILVSEKEQLYIALMHTHQALMQKEGEAEDLVSHLQSERQRVSELEHTLSAVSTQQKQVDKANQELTKEHDNLKVEFCKQSKSYEALKQHNSELEEKLRVLLMEKSAMQRRMEELHRKLEMREPAKPSLLQPGDLNGNQQLQQALEEWEQLQLHGGQLTETLKNTQQDKDTIAEALRKERAICQEQVQQFREQVRTPREEKLQKLEDNLVQLKNETAAPPSQKPPAGPSEMGQRLQAEASQLRKKLEHLAGQLQAQMKGNEDLSHLSQEQEVRLLQLEQEAELCEEQAAEQKHILENMENNCGTITHALSQNCKLTGQLDELQNDFLRLGNKNMEVTNALHSVKTELAKKLGKLQENLEGLKETTELKSIEARGLQEQRDQYQSHLEQYILACQQLVAVYQQLATGKEMLQKHLGMQTQLVEKLPHEDVQREAMAEMMCQEFQGTQECLEAANQQNQQLQAQLGLMSLPGEGNATESEQGDEEDQHPDLSIPEDLDSREAMVAFCKSAIASDEERACLRRQLKEQKLRCQHLAHQVTSSQHEPEVPPTTGTGGESVSGDINQALQGDMKKLHQCFAEITQQKLELMDRMEELEHRCLQLSGEIDTTVERITLYQNQRAVMKENHRIKEPNINHSANEKEDIKVKLLEMQEINKIHVSECKEWHGNFMAATKSPADQATTASPSHQEPAGDNGQVLHKGNLANDVGSAKGEALQGQTVSETPTAQQKIQLLRETQYPQDHHGLGNNPCFPFFYRAEEYEEAKVRVI